jgi:hypothetical protein
VIIPSFFSPPEGAAPEYDELAIYYFVVVLRVDAVVQIAPRTAGDFAFYGISPAPIRLTGIKCATREPLRAVRLSGKRNGSGFKLGAGYFTFNS